MADRPPQTKARDERLNALKKAVDKWAEDEQTRLENENAFMRAVQKGRGSEGLATKNLDEVSELLQEEIKEFLLVGGAT